METMARSGEEMVTLPRVEYEDLHDYIERLQETVDIISDTKLFKEIKEALSRVSSGDFLTKEDILR